MSKKKHPEHVNHERWLVSYADFITLLFAFFVVLFASGQSDKKKAQRMSGAFQQAFSKMALFDPHSKTPPLNDGGGMGADPDAIPKPLEVPVASAPDTTAAKLGKVVDDLSRREAASGKVGKGQMEMRKVPDGVAVTLREGGFFPSASADLRPESVEALDGIAAQIGPDNLIRVEGYTDNQPIHSAQFRSNWELSSSRASTIAHYLLDHSGINPAHLSIAGYGEYHPLASNTTEEGRAKNRRVEIVFLKQTQAQPVPQETSSETKPEAKK